MQIQPIEYLEEFNDRKAQGDMMHTPKMVSYPDTTSKNPFKVQTTSRFLPDISQKNSNPGFTSFYDSADKMVDHQKIVL